jgi:two-component system chemotaxis sensor kinase CheA
VDLAKYRTIFIEESTEHFGEIGSALLALEKEPGSVDAIDVVFRMAHSIKGMAASLDYDPITELSHRIEDRMQQVREAGAVRPGTELSLLFQGLSALERMVDCVKDDLPIPAADPELMAELALDGAVVAPGPRIPEADDPEGVAESVTPASAASVPPEPNADVAPAAPRPTSTVRVRTDVLDRFLSTVGEVILNTSQVRTSAATDAGQGAELGEELDRMDRAVGELQRRALELRTTRLQRIVDPLPRAAREIAQRLGKRVEVEIAGAELELDRSILDRLSDPLVHLIRNAVDHGIEAPEERARAGKSQTGLIHIQARREKDSIRIAVIDDGRGIDLERVRAKAVEAGLVHGDLAEDLPPDALAALVFEPGLSTAGEVSEISGRGVGMDAVRATIESLGGAVELESEPECGTKTSLIVPITAAVQRVLLLGVGDETVAVPISKVERVLELPMDRIERSGDEAFALLDDELIPVLDLADRVGVEGRAGGELVNLVLAEMRGERVALAAERVLGQQQIYVKPVPELLGSLRPLAGLTILGDGRPMFLLDLNQIV